MNGYIGRFQAWSKALDARGYGWAKRIITYGLASATVVGCWTWIVSAVVKHPIMESEQRQMHIVDSISTIHNLKTDAMNRKMDTILQGQELLIDVALEGVYTKREIDRFRMLADAEHRQLRRGLEVEFNAKLELLKREWATRRGR